MSDTIAAISTAPGAAMRAVVRISGPDAFSIAGGMLASGPDPEVLNGFSAPRVRLSLSEGKEARARMLVMRAPRSYTTEDTVEFHLPGAAPLAELILGLCLDCGARLAEPGEFTKKAYLGGRINAEQVEGVLGLIESRSDEERSSALHLLRGGGIREAAELRNCLVNVLASIEAYLDFTDEDTEAVDLQSLRHELGECLGSLDKIKETASRRVPFRNLPKAVIVGPPNAGKSSLFNAVDPGARALISHVPGTTRDLLEGEVSRRGMRFFLYDSPGIAEHSDPLEKLARSHLAGMMPGMDAVLMVFDGSMKPPREAIASCVKMSGKFPCVVALNKSDLPADPEWEAYRFESSHVNVSARHGTGIHELLDALCDLLPPPAGEGGWGADLRTRMRVHKAKEAISLAVEQDWEGGLELVAMELREASESIGFLCEKVTDEDVLQAVFSRFCVGK